MRTIYRPRDGGPPIRLPNEWERADCERVDRWQHEAGTVVWWGYGLRVPLLMVQRRSPSLVMELDRVMHGIPEERPVLTRTGRQAVYVSDVVALYADGTLEFRETKNTRRRGPEYEKWWLKRQILLAMGIELVVVGRDGQPAEDIDP